MAGNETRERGYLLPVTIEEIAGDDPDSSVEGRLRYRWDIDDDSPSATPSVSGSVTKSTAVDPLGDVDVIVHLSLGRSSSEQAPPPEMLIELKKTVDAGQSMLALADTAGVSPRELVDLLAAVWVAPPPGSDYPTSHLSAGEIDALEQSGALAEPMPASADRASTRTAVRIAQLTRTALTAEEAGKVIDRGTARVRQRLVGGTLLGIRSGREWRVPRFQFENGDGLSELPGWDQVMGALPRTVHPLTVKHFLDSPSPELTADSTEMSPRQWLLTGGDVVVVVDLAGHLHDLP